MKVTQNKAKVNKQIRCQKLESMGQNSLDAENQLENTPEVIINDTSEIFYPEEELKSLKKCMRLRGFQLQCYKTTGVSDPTLKRFIKDKKGKKKQVDEVRVFVNCFLSAMQQPAKPKNAA